MPEPREQERSPRPRRRRLVREEAVFDGPPRTPAWIVAHADDADAWVTRNELALAEAVLRLSARLGLIESQGVAGQEEAGVRVLRVGSDHVELELPPMEGAHVCTAERDGWRCIRIVGADGRHDGPHEPEYGPPWTDAPAQPSVASPQAEDTWIHPNRMGGVECIYGTRIPVWRVREHAAAGASAADIAALYDGQVTAAQVEAALSLESALPEQQKDADGRRGSPESALNYLAACALDVCENEDEMEAIRSRRDRVLKALRAASEPQQQEPVAWAVESDVGGRRHLFPRAYADKRQATHKARQFMRDRNATVVPLYRAGTQGKQTGGEV